MLCRQCGAQPDEDGQPDCYCHYPKMDCEICEEEFLEIQLDFVKDFKNMEHLCCDDCAEFTTEEKEEWLFSFQMGFEEFRANMKHEVSRVK